MTPAMAQARGDMLGDLAVVILLAEKVKDADDAEGIERLHAFACVCRTKYGLRSVEDCVLGMGEKPAPRRRL